VTTEIVVTSDMSARIDGREIHPVYGTGALIAAIERICRGIIEPHLEDGEDAVGARLEILHREPVPVGETVAITATVATVGPLTLVCEILVRHGGSNIARGSFEQRLVQLADFRTQADARRTAVSS